VYTHDIEHDVDRMMTNHYNASSHPYDASHSPSHYDDENDSKVNYAMTYASLHDAHNDPMTVVVCQLPHYQETNATSKTSK
jgi:hypothetical protein